ncbi:MAG TPA: hypothetical protein VK555_05975 [Terriglobales bacterium]|nr:hypothetical protein [Terriglobales bacterium]
MATAIVSRLFVLWVFVQQSDQSSKRMLGRIVESGWTRGCHSSRLPSYVGIVAVVAGILGLAIVSGFVEGVGFGKFHSPTFDLALGCPILAFVVKVWQLLKYKPPLDHT